MFLKKLTVMAAPLIICALLCVLFPVIAGLGFFVGVLRGILLGLGLGGVLFLVYKPQKTVSLVRLLWTPVVLIMLLLLYQFLTDAGMLTIPAMAFLNATNVNTVIIESAMLAFLCSLLFITRK